MCQKITRDYMYVNVKKYPSHELDTFAPSVYFYVPQDYTRLHVCQCQERCLPTHILDVGYILHIIVRIFLNKTDTNWEMKRILRVLLKQNTALFSTFRVSVTGVTSHIFHIYKGLNAM